MLRTLFTIAAAASLLAACTRPDGKYYRNTGFVFGTTYNIVYRHTADLQDSILLRLKQYDNSLSTYNPNSVISRINRNETDTVDAMFAHVYRNALKFNELSGGVFDITVAPLSRLWKFAGDHPDTISVATYDSIVALVPQVMPYVGIASTHLSGDTVIVKSDPRTTFDACALAEGYGIDLAAQVLEEYGVADYMVELGGELHMRGVNPQGIPWRIGVDKPVENGNILDGRTMQLILSLTDCSVSTSGSYRQFYYTADGRRLQHTIDPRTGRPVEHGMLSVTVIGPNTMTTDALSTSFMVLGPEPARQLAATMDSIEVYFIYEDSLRQVREYMSDGFRALVVEH